MGIKGRRLLAWVAALCSCRGNPAQIARNPSDSVTVEPTKPASSEEDLSIPIGPEDAVWGARSASVTLVVFSDFECGPCAEMEITLDELKDRWGPNELRIVFKNMPLPFHPHARDAAEAAQGVRSLGGNEAFWIFHGLAFTTEDDLAQGLYEDWASRAGIDVGALRSGLSQKTWDPKVRADEALAKKLGVTDVPAFFVNGVEAPKDKLASVVSEERQKAHAKLDEGTSADAIYRTMSQLNRP
jgi:protein-disulfide isomerase